ncbi:MAG: hypothetical protein IJF84_10145 [Thermoguttaceae bacterium]|nr:hypothetical protein [Thermoguttaceae bacterium]
MSLPKIAIVGIACRLPGASNVDEFWKLVCEGRTAIGPVPDSRLNRKLFYDPRRGIRNKTYTDLAALIDYPAVDRSRTPLPPDAEYYYDRVPLAMCSSVADACRSAGIDPFNFPIRNTGVYIGTTRPGDRSEFVGLRTYSQEALYELGKIDSFKAELDDSQRDSLLSEMKADFLRELEANEANIQEHMSSQRASDSGELISKALHLNGPYMVFNSACASSLFALSQAMMALQNHSIDAAIAGGASYFHSDTLVLFAGSQSMTANRSCPFDEDADGMVVGEGNVVFILKRLEDAIRDNDDIKAVIAGYGIASDGKGKSLWAPRKEGQIEAMRRAYASGLNPADIDYIEGHATSTALGDLTEMEALTAVFGDCHPDKKIPIGSSKGNVGHTLESAGATGVLKAVLVLQNKYCPPVAGLKKLSSKIPWDKVPVIASNEGHPLEKISDGDRPLRVGVNSFGIGGLDVHLVIEEWRGKEKCVASPTVTSSPDKSAPIAIVGTGCIYPDAYSMKAYSDLLSEGKNGIKLIPEKRWNYLQILEQREVESEYPVGQPEAAVIDKYVYDWKKNKIPPKQVANASPLQFMALDAVNEAMADAGFDFSEEHRCRAGVIVGASFGGWFSDQMNIILWLPLMEECLRKQLSARGVASAKIDKIVDDFINTMHKKMPALMDETGSFTPSALSSRITKSLDLHGGATALEGGYATSGMALGCCINQLRVGMNDLMICVCGQQDFGPVGIDITMSRGVWAKDGRISPFDVRSNGFVQGEGVGVLVLMRYEDAVKQGYKIHAVIDEVGVGSGSSITDNLLLAMERSGVKAGSMPSFIEGDFNGVAEKDAAAVEAISVATRQFTNNGKTVLGSVVNQIGYLPLAEGAASILAVVENMKKGKWSKSPCLNQPSLYYTRYSNIEVPKEEKTMQNDALVGVCSGDSICSFVKLHK